MAEYAVIRTNTFTASTSAVKPSPRSTRVNTPRNLSIGLRFSEGGVMLETEGTPGHTSPQPTGIEREANGGKGRAEPGGMLGPTAFSVLRSPACLGSFALATTLVARPRRT